MLSVLVSCGGDEPIDPTPVTPVTPVNPPTQEKDTMAPTITVSKSTINIISGPSITVLGNEIKIGNDVVASWKDDKSTTCTVTITLTPTGCSAKTINSGDKLSEEGKLQVKVSDEAGNSSTAEITLTRTDSQAPEIEVKIPEKNVIAGVKVKIEGNQLFFDSEIAASWKDDYSESPTVELSIAGEKINSGDILFDAGTLVISVADEFQNKATAEITLTAVAITGLESLKNLSLQVDQEVNLLEGLSIAEGLSLERVEVEQDGQRSEIADATKYTPEVPGSISIILTLVRTGGSTIEVKVENLTVQGIQYQSLSITDLKPVEILPIIGQVESGDKNAYDHIEHLRVAEATRIRDMMWEYGTGKHSPEEYKELMGRLNIGITRERPLGYDNYESTLGLETFSVLASSHASNQWSILLSLI